MPAPRFVLDDFWPSDLFLGGIPGAWYDPTDLSTMFQDSAGTTPVTAVEQPVGLILDKSQGLAQGSQLVVNGDGTTLTGWTVSVDPGCSATVSGGQFVLTTVINFGSRLRQTVPVTAGKTYAVSVFINAANVGAPSFQIWGTGYGAGTLVAAPYIVNGTFTAIVQATSANLYMQLNAYSSASGITSYYDNVSVVELAGNHASQSTAASRPTYRARYNLLTYSEQFDNAVWTAGKTAGTTVTPNTDIAPDGTLTADTVAFATNADYLIQQITGYSAVVGNSVTFSIYAKTQTQIIVFGGASPAGTDVYSVTAAANGFWRQTLRRTFTVTATGTLQMIPGSSIAGAGSYVLWGAQLLTAADVTATGNAYQRIAAATVYDTAPIFRPYLAFDGVDDGLATAAITPGTDKCQVFSGLANIAGTNFAIVAEMSANAGSNNGSALLYSPDNVLANYYGFLSRGTINVAVATNNATFKPPAINVVSGLGDISGDVATLRVNGAQIVTSGSDQGTGNYLSYPLYIGRRGGVSAPFNGRVYSLILRFGANLSASEISETELWVNARCGAY